MEICAVFYLFNLEVNVSYLPLTSQKLREAYNNIATMLSRNADFDSIVVTGNSGVIVGGIVALEYGKNLIIIRKPKESNHGSRIECPMNTGNPFIIIDDFIDSGATMDRIFDQLQYLGGEWKDGQLTKRKCKGIFLYNQNPDSEFINSFISGHYDLRDKIFACGSL